MSITTMFTASTCTKKLLQLKMAMSILLLMAVLFFKSAFAQKGPFNRLSDNQVPFVMSADFKQAANNNPPFPQGTFLWINSTLNATNSKITEGMSTLQRVIFRDMLPTVNNRHVLRIKMEAQKSGHHAHDFITGWNQALGAAETIAPGMGLYPPAQYGGSAGSYNLDNGNSVYHPNLRVCGSNISSDASLICQNYHSATSYRDIPVSGETNLILPGDAAGASTATRIATYEARYGARTLRVWAASFGGAAGDANNRVEFVKYEAGYIFYDIKWESSDVNAELEFAAHVAAGIDGLDNDTDILINNVGYGIDRGAFNISGGPCHVILDSFLTGEGNVGSQDLQLQSSAIIVQPTCVASGPATGCAGGGLIGPFNVITNASEPTITWSIINSTQTTPATIVSGQGTTGPVTVNPGSAGSFDVRVLVANAGVLFTTCITHVIIYVAPTITCPANTTTAACQTQAQVDAAYATWLATASATSGTITNNSTGAPDKCGGTKTVTFTATSTCPATCSATFTVAAPPAVILNCPANTTIAACQTQAAVNAAYTAWLASATASGSCNGSLSNNSTGAPPACGGTSTVVFTYTTSCAPFTTSCIASFTVNADLAPPSITNNPPSTIDAPCGTPFQNLPWQAPVWSDNCGTVIPVFDVIIPGQQSTICPSAYTRIWAVTDGCGNLATASQTIAISESHIMPTDISCCQYSTGAAQQFALATLCYKPSTGPGITRIGTVVPDGFMYYAKVVAPKNGPFVIDVIQTANTGCLFQIGNLNQIRLFTTNCSNAEFTASFINGNSSQARMVVNSYDPGATYIVSVEYQTSSISQCIILGTPSFTYNFVALVNADPAPASSGSVNLNPNCDVSPPGNCSIPSAMKNVNQNIRESIVKKLSVEAYPNPFADVVRFSIRSDISGQAQLEIINMLGQRVAVVYNGYIDANKTKTLEYKIPAVAQENLVYILRLGERQVTGKLLKIK